MADEKQKFAAWIDIPDDLEIRVSFEKGEGEEKTRAVLMFAADSAENLEFQLEIMHLDVLNHVKKAKKKAAVAGA